MRRLRGHSFGYRRTCWRTLLLIKRSGVLSRSTRAVTSPTRSSGSMTAPFSRKWSFHLSSLGLNNGTKLPADAIEAIFEPLYRLQTKQAYARFSAIVSPPCCLLIM
jgi:hypothetical protein